MDFSQHLPDSVNAVVHSDNAVVHSDNAVVHSDNAVVHSDNAVVHSDNAVVHANNAVVHANNALVHTSASAQAIMPRRTMPRPYQTVYRGMLAASNHPEFGLRNNLAYKAYQIYTSNEMCYSGAVSGEASIWKVTYEKQTDQRRCRSNATHAQADCNDVAPTRRHDRC
jgi:hypothetical protein